MTTTRRTALMGALAVPVAAALPAAASAAVPDPIFAAIERFQRLEDEWSDREIELDALPRAQASVPTTPEREAISSVEYGTDEEGDRTMILRHRYGEPTGKYGYATSAAEIESAAKSIPEAHRAHWIADRRAALAREIAKARRENIASGRAAAARASDDAYAAQFNAGWDLAETKPTTLAGIAALLAEIDRYGSTDSDTWAAAAFEMVIETLGEMAAV
jgi:hypothetical protein